MIKLYLDEDVHKKIALFLRLKGYDHIIIGLGTRYSSKYSNFGLFKLGFDILR